MMKYIKALLVYSGLFFFLLQLYDPYTLQDMIFHYQRIDFCYLIFMMIQFFWITLLFEIVYQYICMSTFIQIRIHKYQTYLLFSKQILGYICIYFLIHIILFSFTPLQIDYFLLFLNLLIQIISFVLVIVLKKGIDYSYFFIIIFTLFLHFVV